MNTPLPSSGICRLAHWGLIRATGPDAATFLQGQLTNDLVALAPGRWCLAGFCSAKGRLQASFTVWRAGPEDFLLACAASVLPATLKRLGMFVLRAKCRLGDASAEQPLVGATGQAALAAADGLQVGAVARAGDAWVLRLADVDGVARAVVVGAAAGAGIPPGLADAPALPLDAWRLLEVRAGVPLIEAATAEQFVPQMVNYELVGGVDFHKGCYPGQEVVARSQYRGTIKRRMFVFDCDAPASAGQEVFEDADPSQPAGQVVNAAAFGGRAVALVEVKLAALGGTLHLGAPDGALLHRADLPYAVPADAAQTA